MMLITGAAGTPPSAPDIARALEARTPGGPAHGAIARIVERLRTPGDPVIETLKAAAPWIGDLVSYERWGYAVFLFIHWQGVRCVLTLRAVPEGYGIPFVR